MKAGFIGTVVLFFVLLGALVWAFGRISELEDEVSDLKMAQSAKSLEAPSLPRTRLGTPAGPVATKADDGRRIPPSPPGAPVEEDVEEPSEPSAEQAIGELIRAFTESEAGAALQNWGNQARADRVFAPLIDEFAFNEEEKAYFLELVGPAVGTEEALWSKLMRTQDRAEREAIVAEHEAAAAKREADLRSFLNNEQDFERYENYEARLQEYEQMPAIKAAMEAAGEPLSGEQETQLIEIMHDARAESGISENWQGRGVITQLENPGMGDRIKDDWGELQQSLDGEVEQVLTPAQREAFDNAQARTLQALTMGIRFAEAATRGGGQSE